MHTVLVAAAGFAATENILYLARAHMSAETVGLVTVFVLRAFTSRRSDLKRQ